MVMRYEPTSEYWYDDGTPDPTANKYWKDISAKLGPEASAWIMSGARGMNTSVANIDTPDELDYFLATYKGAPHSEDLSYQLAGYIDPRVVGAWKAAQAPNANLTAVQRAVIDNPGMVGQSLVRPDIPNILDVGGVAAAAATDNPAAQQALIDKYGLGISNAATNWASQNTAAAQAARSKAENGGLLGDLTVPVMLGASIFGAPYLSSLLGGGMMGAAGAGAVLGGGGAALTGGDVLRGALMGGAGGALSSAVSGALSGPGFDVNVPENFGPVDYNQFNLEVPVAPTPLQSAAEALNVPYEGSLLGFTPNNIAAANAAFNQNAAAGSLAGEMYNGFPTPTAPSGVNLAQQFQDQITTQLNPLGSQVSQLGNDLSGFRTNVGDWQNALSGQVNQLGSGLADVQSQVSGLPDWLQTQLADQNSLYANQISSAVNPLTSQIGGIQQQLAGLPQTWQDQITTQLNPLASQVGGIQQQLAGLPQTWQDQITTQLNPLGSQVGMLQQQVGDLPQQWLQDLTTRLSPLDTNVAQLQQQISTLPQQWQDQITTQLNPLGSQIGQLNTGLSGLQQQLSGIPDFFQNALAQQSAQQNAGQLAFSLGSALGAGGNNMGWLEDLIGASPGAVDPLTGEAINTFTGNLGDLTYSPDSSWLQNLLSGSGTGATSGVSGLLRSILGGGSGGNTGTGALLGTGANALAGILQGRTSQQAAQTAADAQVQAARIAADAAKFKPVGVATRFGTSNFGFDANGNLTSAGYTVDPTLKAQQDRLLDLSGTALDQVAGASTATAPMSTAAQRAMALGQQYLGTDPAAQAAKFMQEQQALLAPGRERELAALENRLLQQGRLGLATGGTRTMGAANPELEAFANAKRMQDLQLAAQATQGGMDYAKFGAGMVGTGGDLLKGMYGTQVAAYAPYQSAITGAEQIENLGQNALNIGTSLGNTATAASAASGRAMGQGMNNAAATMQPANAFNPWATALGGFGGLLSQNSNPWSY